jgi:hypothetical protein
MAGHGGDDRRDCLGGARRGLGERRRRGRRGGRDSGHRGGAARPGTRPSYRGGHGSAVPWLAAIVPTTPAALPAIPRQTAGTIVSHYISALVSGLSSTKDWDFTVGLCAVLFLCGYWLGWTALREHRGVLAVVPIFSVLATNVVNAKNPNAVAVPETIAVCLSLAVIAAAHLGSLSDRWASARVTPLHGLRWRFGSSAAGVAVGVTILALFMPAISNIDISGALFSHTTGSGAGGSGGGSGGNGAATIGFSSSVELGGPLVSQPKQVLS